jgi:hypothetical protein
MARLAVVAAGAVLIGCTSSTAPSGPSAPASTHTTIETLTRAPHPDPSPVVAGPTVAAPAASCPFLDEQAVADDVGMRLARVEVLTSAGRVRGCQIYALQHSQYHASEHLPGPRQPAVEVTATEYASANAAHNAVARLADAGQDPRRARIGAGIVGACYRTSFDPTDHGQDWACAFSRARTEVQVRTAVVSPASDALEVARAAAPHF